MSGGKYSGAKMVKKSTKLFRMGLGWNVQNCSVVVKGTIYLSLNAPSQKVIPWNGFIYIHKTSLASPHPPPLTPPSTYLHIWSFWNVHSLALIPKCGQKLGTNVALSGWRVNQTFNYVGKTEEHIQTQKCVQTQKKYIVEQCVCSCRFGRDVKVYTLQLN